MKKKTTTNMISLGNMIGLFNFFNSFIVFSIESKLNCALLNVGIINSFNHELNGGTRNVLDLHFRLILIEINGELTYFSSVTLLHLH